MFFLNTLRIKNLDEIAVSCLVKEINVVLMLAFLWEIVNFKKVTIFDKTSAAVYIPHQHMHDNFIISIVHNYTVQVLFGNCLSTIRNHLNK